MEELLQELGIFNPGHAGSNNSYVVDIYNSDDYSKIFSTLENSDKLSELEDQNQVNKHSINVSYITEDEDYEISLIGDLDNDEYKLVVRKQ